MAMSYIKLYYDFSKTLKLMPDDAAGRLIKAIFDYVIDGEEPQLENGEQYVFMMLQSQLDRDKTAYEKTVVRNQENGKRGGRPSKTQENPVGFSETQENPEEPTKSQDKNNIREEKEEDKTKTKNKDKEEELYSNSAACSSEPATQQEPAVFNLWLNNDSYYGVTQTEIDEYQKLYPIVDVPQEFRNMIGWINANPAKRKTPRGIKRFINGWLADKQNKGGSRLNMGGGYYNGGQNVVDRRTSFTDSGFVAAGVKRI